MRSGQDNDENHTGKTSLRNRRKDPQRSKDSNATTIRNEGDEMKILNRQTVKSFSNERIDVKEPSKTMKATIGKLQNTEEKEKSIVAFFLFPILQPVFLLLLVFVTAHLSILVYQHRRSSFDGFHWTIGLAVCSIFTLAMLYICYHYRYFLKYVVELIVVSVPRSWYMAPKDGGGEKKPSLLLTEKECLELFQLFDRDQDGYIALAELRAVLTSLPHYSYEGHEGEGLNSIAQILNSDFDFLDEDGDGKLNYGEFRSIFLR